MMDNSDDYDFTPSASSNLRSLFANSGSTEDSSLIYTAPKQPKPTGTTEVKCQPGKTETSVICAQVVQAWKLNDGKYIGVGKHGFALIGSLSQTSCEIILYRDKRNVIARAKIDSNFEFTLKKDDFASFYDTSKENWLIKFNSNEEYYAIINHIEKYGGKIIPPEDIINENKAPETKKIDSSSAENKVRADILSRIAKMGQSILPSKTLDSEPETLQSADTSTSSVYSEHLGHSSDNSSANSSVSVLTPSTVIQAPRPIQNVPSTFIMAQPMPYDPLNVYVAENRAQNSEIRMNLTQINEKLNSIMKSVDTNKSSTEPDCDVLKSKVKVFELRIENLSKELATVQDENVKLKEKIIHQDDLLKNEQQNRIQLKLLQEGEGKRLETLERETQEYKNTNEELLKELEMQKNEIENVNKKIASFQDDLKWKDEAVRLESVVSELEKKLKGCEESCKQNTKTISDEETKEKNVNFIATLKEQMNEMYASIVGNINRNQQDSPDISGVIAHNIKNTTLKIIQNFQHLYESEQT